MRYFVAWRNFVPIYTAASLATFWALRMYRSVWRFAGYNEFKNILIASGITALFHMVFITILFRPMPVAYCVIGAVLQFILLMVARFGYRLFVAEKKRRGDAKKVPSKRVMLIGAGMAGQMILQDMHNSESVNERVCCIIDDNPDKWGRMLEDVPIVYIFFLIESKETN